MLVLSVILVLIGFVLADLSIKLFNHIQTWGLYREENKWRETVGLPPVKRR